MSPTNFFANERSNSWTLAEIYADIGSREDIARTLNVGRRRVAHWLDKERRERLGCPYPIRRVGHVDLYSMQEWKDWFERFQEKHKDRKDSKWMDQAQTHGSGESFWAYFNDED